MCGVWYVLRVVCCVLCAACCVLYTNTKRRFLLFFLPLLLPHVHRLMAAAPEMPDPPRITDLSPTSCRLFWDMPNDNGMAINRFDVEVIRVRYIILLKGF